MPPAGVRGQRGDLILRLDVDFPVVLPRPCKALLDQALQLAEQGVARARGGGPSASARGGGRGRGLGNPQQ